MTENNSPRHVDFIDQTLRDGPQSLWGMVLEPYEAVDALPHLARAGYRTIDVWGAGSVPVKVRAGSDPWPEIDAIVERLGGNQLRTGLRTITASGFAPAPQSILDLWVQTVIKHGMTSMWLYDCLFDMPQMKHMVDVVLEAGGQPVPAVMYGHTPVHGDDFFADRTRQMAGWEGVESIYIEDAAGVLTHERGKTLLPALREAAEGVLLEAHFHNTTALAPHNYITAIQAGFDSIHTASRPMANGPSLPSTETMATIVEHLGMTHSLDTSTFAPVADNFDYWARTNGHRLGAPADYDPRIYDHQLPGGMTGTLINQLAKQGMSDRFEEVLATIPQVRRELGEPIMATPFSQLVGIQAVMNLITGDPYAMVSDEVIHYTLGHYGPLASPVDPNVADKILSSSRARELESWERPDLSLKEIRQVHGLNISDEELLLRFLSSDEDVDRLLRNPSPVRIDSRRSSNNIVNHVVELINEKTSATSLSVTTPEFRVSLARATNDRAGPM